mgnify:FL=1
MDNVQIQPQSTLLSRIGLEFNPFPVTPDADRYFLSDRTHQKLTELLHCIESRKGFMLVTADIGIGKTTLSRRLIGELNQRNTDVALVINSFLHGESLLQAIVADFGLNAEGSIADVLATLNTYLLSQFHDNQNCCIIIDDAQNLDLESLELIRQLSNLETNQHKLVQILLIAQPEIQTTLAYPEIRQLNSRIALHVELEPFSLAETRAYVEYRLTCAGNAQGIHLSHSALKQLWRESQGYPRQINLIMDRCLYALMAGNTQAINGVLMNEAIQDLGRLKANQQNTRHTWQPALVASLIIVVGLGFLALQPRTDLAGRISLTLDQWLTPDTAATVAIAMPQTDTQARIPTPTPTASSPTTQDPALTRFLAHYDLAPLEVSLSNALTRNQLDLFEQALTSSPWQLIRSARPLLETNNVATLRHQTISGQEEWLLLWQPPYQINAFHFGVKSHAVAQLQHQLAQLGHYTTSPDGIVGGHTKTALARFQEQNGLIPSGDTNPLTLYLLQQAVPESPDALRLTAGDVRP